MQYAHEHQIGTILNPASAQILDLKEAGIADYVIRNETEAELRSGMPVQKSAPETSWTEA